MAKYGVAGPNLCTLYNRGDSVPCLAYISTFYYGLLLLFNKYQL